MPTTTIDDAPDDDLDAMSYTDAVTELESILAEIEDDTVDIDQLSRRVRRAAALIRLCQERIVGARLEVERVVADLTIDAAGTAPDDDPDDGAGRAEADPDDDPDGDADDLIGADDR